MRLQRFLPLRIGFTIPRSTPNSLPFCFNRKHNIPQRNHAKKVVILYCDLVDVLTIRRDSNNRPIFHTSCLLYKSVWRFFFFPCNRLPNFAALLSILYVGAYTSSIFSCHGSKLSPCQSLFGRFPLQCHQQRFDRLIKAAFSRKQTVWSVVSMQNPWRMIIFENVKPTIIAGLKCRTEKPIKKTQTRQTDVKSEKNIRWKADRFYVI